VHDKTTFQPYAPTVLPGNVSAKLGVKLDPNSCAYQWAGAWGGLMNGWANGKLVLVVKFKINGGLVDTRSHTCSPAYGDCVMSDQLFFYPAVNIVTTFSVTATGTGPGGTVSNTLTKKCSKDTLTCVKV
jgi:hypothetical protein